MGLKACEPKLGRHTSGNGTGLFLRWTGHLYRGGLVILILWFVFKSVCTRDS